MKKRMEHLLNGKFHYDGSPLLFSKEKIAVTMSGEESLREEVYIGTEDRRKIRGFVTSSNRRIVPGISEFSGTTVCIPYGLDSVGMQPGEVCEGWICFSTSIGEYKIPVRIEVEKKEVVTSQGQIRTLDEFTKFAKENFREAYRLFHSESFREILKSGTEQERAWYAGFTSQPVTYQSLEEFLIACGRKERVEITLKEEGREIFGLKESVREPMKLLRHGWGHLRLSVETRGDFLEVEKHVITEEDFIGSSFILEYLIHYERLGKGKQFGEIRISSPYETKRYQVVVSKNLRSEINVRTEERRRRMDMMQDYLDYRCHKTSAKEWAASAHYQLNRLKETGFDYPEYALYEAYVFHQEGKDAEAQPILTGFREKSFRKEDIEFAGVYLWLCTLTGLYKDRESAVRRIEGFYRQKEESVWLLFALLDLDQEYRTSGNSALYALEEQFRKGSRNPLLYLKAWEILQDNLKVFHRISDFWVQVFLYAGRNDLLTAEPAMRFAYLSGYEKRWQECLYQVLEFCCERFKEDDELEAICRYVMLGNPRKAEYFRWYEESVRRGLRITRLYEYYMETLDLSRHIELPKSLLMYFSYNNSSLGDTRKAYLYTSVIDAKEKEPEIFERYQERIRQFAFEKLREGKTGEDYARIYQEFCMNPETPEDANALASQLFSCRLYCDDRKVRNIIVRHAQLAKEEVYPCVQGIAYPKIYTEDAVLLFQDERQRRYGTTVAFNCKKLMESREVEGRVLKRGASFPGLLLSYCSGQEIDRENLPIFGSMVEMDGFTEEYLRETRKKILEFYTKDVRGIDLDMYLRKLDLREYARVDRTMLLEILINHGFYPEAMKVIREFGYEGLDWKSLLKLTSRMILTEEDKKDEELLALASAVYREGLYDEVILRYLMKYRMGTMEELIQILHSARGFDLETYGFEERILNLLILEQDFRKEGEKVLEDYVHRVGKERIIGGYLTHLSYGNFIKEYPITKFTEKCLEKAYVEKWPVNRICHLALFQSLCKNKHSSHEQERLKEELLQECMQDQLIFAFYRKLPGELLSPYQLDDKTFVECHAAKDAKVTLYYQMDQGLGKEGDLQSEPLTAMYEGIFVKAFTLFYGETLRYSFRIEEKGKERKTAEKVLTMNRIEGNDGTKYLLLNEILSERKLGQMQNAAERLKAYLQKERFVKEMFATREEPENE